MASNVRTTAGATLGISLTAPTTYDQAGFDALTPNLISDITEYGEIGRVYNLVTHSPVDFRGIVKRKGSYNEGALTLQLGRDGTNAGQVDAATARDSDDSAYFILTLQNGERLVFSAQVMSFTYNLGNVDSITAGSIVCEIDRDILLLPALP